MAPATIPHCRASEGRGKNKIFCTDDAVARGYCNRHFQRVLRSPTGDPGPVGRRPAKTKPRPLREGPLSLLASLDYDYKAAAFPVHPAGKGKVAIGTMSPIGNPTFRSLLDRGLARRLKSGRCVITAAGRKLLQTL